MFEVEIYELVLRRFRGKTTAFAEYD